jgi:hypothetical protein
MEWRPWNTVHFDHTPTFLRNAERKQIAVQMIKIFKVPNVEEFRRRMLKRAPSDGHATGNGATRYREFAMASGEMRLEEGGAGKRRPSTANALWLKPRLAVRRLSSVPHCERGASLARRLKWLSEWPFSNRMLDAGRPDSVRRLNVAA